METGDIYIDAFGYACIHLDGSESAFRTTHFNKKGHAALERGSLMYNCTIEDVKATGINIFDLLKDPETIEVLKKLCNE